MACKKEFWKDSDVRCPFYLSGDRERRSLRCEGFCEDSYVTSSFKSLAAREKHMGAYCVGRYERCPLYKCTYGAKYDD